MPCPAPRLALRKESVFARLSPLRRRGAGMSAGNAVDATLDWNRVLPAAASTRRAELHLVCGDEVIFFDPVNSIGCLWRPLHQVAQTTGPVTAPEFVKAMLARGVALPRGREMLRWSAAVTEGLIVTCDAAAFLLVADEMERMAREHETPGGTRH